MKFSSPIKRKKPEIKPVKLSYYSHPAEQKTVLTPVPRKYRNSIRIILIFILVGALIPIFYYLFTKYKWFQIAEIQVNGPNNYVSVGQVRGYMENKLLGTSILKIKPSTYEKALTGEFPAIEKVLVTSKLPDKVLVNVSERTPVAVLVTNDQKYLVDKEGYIIQVLKEPDSKYSEIIYSEKVSEGQFINQSIVPLSVEILKHAKDSNLVINKMQFNSQYITLNINDNIEIDLSLAEDTGLAIKQVAAIVQKTSSESQKLRKIDLRFEKVIVLYD